MCDGVVETPAAGSLPAPFDQLSERTWRRLRAYDWREDLARLSEDLRALGVVPRTTPAPLGSAAVAARRARRGRGRGNAASASAAGSPSSAARSSLLGGGVAAWRWQEEKAASVAGRWRANIGKKGASSSRDGEIVNVTIEQSGASLRVASSAVDIEQDPDWQKYRAFWQERFGQPLNRVFYRGEGVLQSDEVTAPGAPPGPRRVLLSVHVDPPEGGAPIDTGALRGTIDPDGNRIRARLWLKSEQGERVVDLRREP